jgi:cytochrome P450
VFPVAGAVAAPLQFPYTCAVVTEALRLYPPGANTLRETNDEPFQLGPYTLPARTTLVVGTYVMQRDPKIWPQAATFMPERWLPVSVRAVAGDSLSLQLPSHDCLSAPLKLAVPA